MQLKNKIIAYVQENQNDFQLVNNTINHFKEYIYDDSGEYLIGGELISLFIKKFINLYVNNIYE